MMAMAVLCAPSAALADSASVDFIDAAGNSDPVVGVGRTMVVTGSTNAPKYVYVKSRPAGGAPCAPTSSSDSGDIELARGYLNGAFRVTDTDTWRKPAGSYLFCTWLTASGATSGPFTQIINFRNPTASITAVVSPLAPLAGQRGTLLISGASEAPGRLYAKMRPAGGAPCAPSFTADSGTVLVTYKEVNGGYRVNANVTQRRAGAYLACLWLTRESGSDAPLALQSTVFTVRSPCRVPTVGRTMTLRGAKSALVRARCRVGKVRYGYSKGRKRGRVMRFGWKAGERFEPGTKVAIVVSKGKRPRRR